MKKIVLFTVAILFLSIIMSNCQTNPNEFPVLTGLYIGQISPEMKPEIFAPGIISTDQFEFGGTFSPNFTEYYFTRRPDLQGSENRIYYTKLKNGKWTKPELAPFANDCFEFIPSISPAGDKLYFYSDRPKANDVKYNGNLWFCSKTENGWSSPLFLDLPANQNFSMTISATSKDVLYYSAVVNRKLCILKVDPDKQQEPEMLPEYINKYNPAHPFIAPDESYLIFDAQPTGMGKSELFICFKMNNVWSDPINMGGEINATKTEFNGSVSPDGKYFFFHRRVNGNGDIWWVSTEIFDHLKPKDL